MKNSRFFTSLPMTTLCKVLIITLFAVRRNTFDNPEPA